jgi:hypothetical protein
MIFEIALIFIVPCALLGAAWWRYLRDAKELGVPRWRLYSGTVALVLASGATVLELLFFLSWYHNGGNFYGPMPSPGIWKFVGRIAFGMFLTCIVFMVAGKGRWKIWASAWAVSLCVAVLMIMQGDLR